MCVRQKVLVFKRLLLKFVAVFKEISVFNYISAKILRGPLLTLKTTIGNFLER